MEAGRPRPALFAELDQPNPLQNHLFSGFDSAGVRFNDAEFMQ